jgi:hypothetical protein
VEIEGEGTLMASQTPKKEPQMTRLFSHEGLSQQEIENQEFEAELNSFIYKVQDAIDDARERMTDEDRTAADANAAAILKDASSSAGRLRKGA